MSAGTEITHARNDLSINNERFTSGARWFRHVWQNRTLFISGLALAVIGLAALWPALFTTISPYDTNTRLMLKAPSVANWFGTDHLGRDVFSRVVHGARHSLLIGFGATAIGLVVGVAFGTLAALGGRALDTVVMRVIDVLLSFPNLLFSMLVIAFLGSGTSNLTIAIGVASIPGFARVVRSELLVTRRSLFVEAGIAMGLTRAQLIVRHILPNSVSAVLIFATISVGTSILAGSALSFLGMGPQAPIPEWGLLLSEGRSVLHRAWWLGFFPGLFLSLTVIAATVFGRSLHRLNGGGQP